MIRVVMPQHLRTLARVEGEVRLPVQAPVTIGATLDALEAEFPALEGAIRDHVTRKRRPFIRYFACEQDLSHEPAETELPPEVTAGSEAFWIVGAIAGGC